MIYMTLLIKRNLSRPKGLLRPEPGLIPQVADEPETQNHVKACRSLLS